MCLVTASVQRSTHFVKVVPGLLHLIKGGVPPHNPQQPAHACTGRGGVGVCAQGAGQMGVHTWWCKGTWASTNHQHHNLPVWIPLP